MKRNSQKKSLWRLCNSCITVQRSETKSSTSVNAKDKLSSENIVVIPCQDKQISQVQVQDYTEKVKEWLKGVDLDGLDDSSLYEMDKNQYQKQQSPSANILSPNISTNIINDPNTAISIAKNN